MDRYRLVVASVAMLALAGLATTHTEAVGEFGDVPASLDGKERDLVVASAESGLDLHWNTGYTDYYLFLSYIGTDDIVHVLRRRSGVWEDVLIDFHTLSDLDTSVTAYEDTVMVAYAYPYAEGGGVRYLTSYDGGEVWWIGILAQPGAGEGWYNDFDITAKGGGGTVAVFDHEEGAFDPIYFQLRPGYAVGGHWDERVVFGEHDVVTGTPLALEWLGDHAGYGMVYIADQDDRLPYFVSLQPFPLFADGFESGDTSVWSAPDKSLRFHEPVYPARAPAGLEKAGNEPGGTTFGVEDLTIEPRASGRPSLLLGSLSPDQAATLEVELGPRAEADLQAMAREIEGMWNSGHRELAAAALEELEARCPGLAVGLGMSQQGAAKSRLADRRLGGTRTGARLADLGYDPATGNLFAVVRWNDVWTFNISTDHGWTWTETYTWGTGATLVDLTVADGKAYVGYVADDPSYGDLCDARLRRFDADSGAVDADYYWKHVADVSPAEIEEIAVESNADDLDTVLFIALLGTDDALRIYWAFSGTGSSFNEFSPCGADTDGDRILDCFETDDGVFVDETATGTDPRDPDTDGDGLLDGDEVLGTLGGLDLPAMGASPVKQDILLEYDWFNDEILCVAHSHRPDPETIGFLNEAFANAPVDNPDGSTGIHLIHDYGQGGVFTGGNLIADADGVLVGGVDGAEFAAHKAANFSANRQGYFHYVMMVHHYHTDADSFGQAERPGDDLIVAMACFHIFEDRTAGVIMHELGHNLILHHGGDSACNYIPSYNSVMNYRFGHNGVDVQCNLHSDGLLDYSVGDRVTLNENDLDEPEGICGGDGEDWNGDGDDDDLGVVADINSDEDYPLADQIDDCGGQYTVLSDYDDWANIDLAVGLTSKAQGEIVSCGKLSP